MPSGKKAGRPASSTAGWLSASLAPCLPVARDELVWRVLFAEVNPSRMEKKGNVVARNPRRLFVPKQTAQPR